MTKATRIQVRMSIEWTKAFNSHLKFGMKIQRMALLKQTLLDVGMHYAPPKSFASKEEEETYDKAVFMSSQLIPGIEYPHEITHDN